MAGFGIVIISVLPTMRLFAMLSCIALVAALFGDLILLPALLAQLGGNLKPETASFNGPQPRRLGYMAM